jgi:metallo-beta-lactamase family protein
LKIRFLGAAHTVTGSCFMIDACGKRFCVDCGMYQGNKTIEARNRDAATHDPGHVDFILVTHAHIDHSGLLPLMVRESYANPIYCTKATADLLGIMLEDSGHIQEVEAKRDATKSFRRGLGVPGQPLYTVKDAQRTTRLLSQVEYHEPFEPAPGVTVTYRDAGHILGSASIEIDIREDGGTTSLLFSGDIGRPGALIVRNTETPPVADYVFMESTYGDRDHKDEDSSVEELARAIEYSHRRGEKVIVPAFAVGRTQEVLYCLHVLEKQGKLPKDMPVFVDSPLAIRATEVFRRNAQDFDDEMHALLDAGEDPFSLSQLRYTLTTEQSQRINSHEGPAVVISASGMCNAGRVRHHLRHNLWRPGASIVFVGFQGVGTPGRALVEGRKKLTLFGEDVAVAARIFTINGFSGHAGQRQLLDWVKPVIGSGTRVILVHGEPDAQAALAVRIKADFGISAIIPGYLEELDIKADQATRISHEAQAHPPVDWAGISEGLERKWRTLAERMAHLGDRPWMEQTELQEEFARLDAALTRSLSKIP